MRLQNREDLISLRHVCLDALNAEKSKIIICAGTGCISGGSLVIYDRLRRMMEERGFPLQSSCKRSLTAMRSA